MHPGTSSDPYEAGGDLGEGALRHVQSLIASHPSLRVTLFVTPDWREISPVPTRSLVAGIPWLRDRLYLSRVHPKGRMRLDRHPQFTSFVGGLERTELALHGLSHVHRGPRLPVEFQDQPAGQCAAMLREALAIFADAGLPTPTGMTPPAWNAPPPLIEAMEAVGLAYVASACDILAPVEIDAMNSGSGLRGVPAFRPSILPKRRLVHIPTNYRATSTWDRAARILECGGLLSVKAHVVKDALGVVALDGLDQQYEDHLHSLFERVQGDFGDSVWWGSMGDVAGVVRGEVQRA